MFHIGVQTGQSLGHFLAAAAVPATVIFVLLGSGAPSVLALAAALLAAVGVSFWLRRSQRTELGRAVARAAGDAGVERSQAEAERDRLATLIAELGDAILIIGGDDRVRLANPAAERLLAVGALVGRRMVEVVRDHEVFEAVSRARAGAEAVGQIEREDPRRLVRVVARPLDGGELLLSLQDLTALRRLETVRRDFVANVSHELRTPIASLAAMADTLEAGAIDDPVAARDFVTRMQSELAGLTQLVEELLSLARIESGAERLQLLALDPVRILTDAVRRMGPLAGRAQITLSVTPGDDLPAVLADGEKVAQVLANLVHNAVKFSAPGDTIRLSAIQQDSTVAFSVSDVGSGLESGALARVFERFYKSDRSRATGGTGLGLAIAKHIVQAHGGEIAAASDGAGRGSTFTFTLPRA